MSVQIIWLHNISNSYNVLCCKAGCSVRKPPLFWLGVQFVIKKLFLTCCNRIRFALLTWINYDESGTWGWVTAKLKWHMQMFTNLYCFLCWWKSCLRIKNNMQNIIHALVLLHRQTYSESRDQIMKRLDQISNSKTNIFISLINSLRILFLVKLAVANAEVFFKCVLCMSCWIGCVFFFFHFFVIF